MYGANVQLESDTAEVVWYVRPSYPATIPVTYTLYRRVFLVVPTTASGSVSTPITVPVAGFVSGDYDHSLRLDLAQNLYIGNTLGDLTKRENRFAHTVIANATGGFPHVVDFDRLVPFGVSTAGVIDTSHPRYGEDVLLTNVLAFDVRVWDPTAPVQIVSGAAVSPGDVGFTTGGATAASGAYVDLNWAESLYTDTPLTPFRTRGSPFSLLAANFIAATKVPATFDTWSFHYEHDGLDQDGDGIVDEATNGFDDNSANGVDDAAERETSPPYPVPLRGVQVRLRCYEPDARQVREVTVKESFLPE